MPRELYSGNEPYTGGPLPLSKDHRLSLADRYLLLALAHDNTRRDADRIDPFGAGDIRDSLFWYIQCSHFGDLLPADKVTFDACLASVEGDLRHRGLLPPEPALRVGVAKEDKIAPPFDGLMAVAKKLRLKGDERTIISALCMNRGQVNVADLATKCEWASAHSSWHSARHRLNRKLKSHGWRLETDDHHAVAQTLPSPDKSPGARK